MDLSIYVYITTYHSIIHVSAVLSLSSGRILSDDRLRTDTRNLVSVIDPMMGQKGRNM